MNPCPSDPPARQNHLFRSYIISSIVISDFYSIFGLRIADDVLSFCFMLAECCILTVLTIIALTFSVTFIKTQKELSPYKTAEGRLDYFQEKMTATIVPKLHRKLFWICMLSVAVLLLNVAKFICVNVIG